MEQTDLSAFDAETQQALNRFPSMVKPEMTARETEAREKAGRRIFENEMENIREHGPLDRITEVVLPENVSSEVHQSMMEYERLAEAGDFEGLRDRVLTTEEIPSSHQGFIQDFFADISASKNAKFKGEAAKLFMGYLRLKAMQQS